MIKYSDVNFIYPSYSECNAILTNSVSLTNITRCFYVCLRNQQVTVNYTSSGFHVLCNNVFPDFVEPQGSVTHNGWYRLKSFDNLNDAAALFYQIVKKCIFV